MLAASDVETGGCWDDEWGRLRHPGALHGMYSQAAFRATTLDALLMTIPGISRRSATLLISELGTDMRAFPSAAHLASWVGLCPGSHLSAGKRRSGKPTKGNSSFRSILVQIAWILTRMSGNYLSAPFHHLRPRLGEKQAVVAVAHSVLVIVYHVLAKEEPYQDLGPDSFRRQDKEQQARRFVHQLETLGYRVELAPQEEVTA